MDGWPRRGCVYGILIENDRAFVVQRKPDRNNYRNMIETPGGKLEPEDGGDYLKALRREWMEEVDLVVEPVCLLRRYDIRHPATDELVPKEVYLVERVSGDVRLKKHEKCYWLTENELAKNEVEGHEFVENFVKDIHAGFRAARESVTTSEPRRLPAAISA